MGSALWAAERMEGFTRRCEPSRRTLESIRLCKRMQKWAAKLK